MVLMLKVIFNLNFKEMVGLNIQIMVLCMFSGEKKAKLSKKSYEFLQIYYKLIEKLKFDFKQEKKGEGFFSIFRVLEPFLRT